MRNHSRAQKKFKDLMRKYAGKRPFEGLDE
jgi:hypothetical protein